MRHQWSILTATMCLIALSQPAAAFEPGPQGVSPGAPDRLARVGLTCPSFSWEAVPDAARYELVVYRIDGEQTTSGRLELSPDTEVLYQSVSGRATSWTPEAADCFAPGGDYVWFVRSVTNVANGDGSEWSEPRYFDIAASPSPEDVQQALDVLTRYLETGEDDIELETLMAAGSTATTRMGSRSGSAPIKTTSSGGRSVTTGTAAIRGEQPDLSGETYGVVGVSASPDGAGIGAANTAGGPDLILDGTVPAELSEAGVDRPSPALQSFSFNNTGGGGMTLDVDGVEVVTTATDSDTLAGLSCSGDEVAKWNGSAWICAPDDDTDTDTVGDLSCGSGQVAKWNGSSWACAPDDDTDTDTLGDLSCGSGQVAKWNGASWICAADIDTDTNTDTLAGLACPTGQIAKRSGSSWICAPDEDDLGGLACGSGQVAKWNGSVWACADDDSSSYTFGAGLMVDDGQVVIDPDSFSLRLSRVSHINDIGEHSSVAIGSDGLGLIAFYYRTGSNLLAAHCSNVLCTSATIWGLDSAGSVGLHPSVAIGSDGLGLISYWENSNYDLKVAHCNNINCSTASISTLDSTGWVGVSNSIAIGTDGYGLISYYDDTNEDLKVAHCNNIDCSTASISTLDSTGRVGDRNSITIGSDGLGLISYYDDTNDNLKVAHCNNISCSTASTSTLDYLGTTASTTTSIAIGEDGLGLIAYHNYMSDSLNVAHCDNTACTSATLSTLASNPSSGYAASLTIGNDGLGLISYNDYNGELKVAHCHNPTCTSASLYTVDTEAALPSSFAETSIVIGDDGASLVTYYDDTNQDLKVAHLPFWY